MNQTLYTDQPVVMSCLHSNASTARRGMPRFVRTNASVLAVVVAAAEETAVKRHIGCTNYHSLRARST